MDEENAAEASNRIYRIISGGGDSILDEIPGNMEGFLICKECKYLCVQCLVFRYAGDRNNGDTDEHGVSIDGDVQNDTNADYVEENFEGDLVPDLSSLDKDRLYESFSDRVKYIPLRLTIEERKKLRILEAALNVSEYTDKVDVISVQRINRMINQIREICSIIAGLIVTSDYNLGQRLFQDRDYAQNVELYKEMFELGRRYKIMNPDKMRSSYGKLMYLLQDSTNPQVNSVLNFDLDRPIRTVYRTLEEINCLAILGDPLLNTATSEIIPDGKQNEKVKQKIKTKEAAVKYLVRKYSSKDNERTQDYLKEYFGRDNKSSDRSLSITAGLNGSRLTHDHKKQYTYVLQSLTLWKEILNDMHKLWFFVDRDMLNCSSCHRLYNTGQGLNRVQPAPETLKYMHVVLERTRKQVGSWVGSAVIHMGDHNVPNALMFIDKYSQVHRILSPIVNVINYIRDMPWKNTEVEHYLQKLGGPDKVCVTILSDFFCSAFDGSGANDYYDAGSCIDGRLTSTWNWCSVVHQKPYYPVFLLSGFIGFDGDWAS